VTPRAQDAPALSEAAGMIRPRHDPEAAGEPGLPIRALRSGVFGTRAKPGARRERCGARDPIASHTKDAFNTEKGDALVGVVASPPR
jgi:hypothetical protein